MLYECDLSDKNEFYWDKQTILDKVRKAINEDKCGAVILASCCDSKLCGHIQIRYPKIPVIYPPMAAMKYCEMMIDNYRNQGIPKQKDLTDYNDVLFHNSPIGHIIGNTSIDNKNITKSS